VNGQLNAYFLVLRAKLVAILVAISVDVWAEIIWKYSPMFGDSNVI
jgi:hypothetical protein